MEEAVNQHTHTLRPSGHDFEYRVADCIRQQDWHVETNSHYVDLITRKSRETDIIAKKGYAVFDAFRNTRADILVRLFIQCKFVQREVELYFAQKNVEAAKKLAKDNQILRSSEDYPLHDGSTTPPKIHHYIAGEEVVLSWNCNPDLVYEAVNQAVHSFIFFGYHLREGPYAVDYPLIIVNSFDTFFRKDAKTQTRIPFAENFQIAYQYTHPQFPSLDEKSFMNKYYMVDVLSFDHINGFLKTLEENDVALLQNQLFQRLTVQSRKPIPGPGYGRFRE
jgi:hypothetical protein